MKESCIFLQTHRSDQKLCWEICCCFLFPKLCPTLWDPMDSSLPGSSVLEISQARILEWIASSFSRGSFWLRDRTCISWIGRQILYHWATGDALSWAVGTLNLFSCLGEHNFLGEVDYSLTTIFGMQVRIFFFLRFVFFWVGISNFNSVSFYSSV